MLLEAIEKKDREAVEGALQADAVWLAEPGRIDGQDAIASHLLSLTLAGHARVVAEGAHVVVRTPEWSAVFEARADGIIFGAQFNS